MSKVKEKFIGVYRYNNSVEVLKISLATCNFDIISANEVDRSKVSVGFFENEKNQNNTGCVALVSTPHGPLLILDSTRYAPKIATTKIEIIDGEIFSRLLIADKGENIFSLFYKGKTGFGSHPYNEFREDVDFFYWLSKNIGNPKLYEYYEKELVYLD